MKTGGGRGRAGGGRGRAGGGRERVGKEVWKARMDEEKEKKDGRICRRRM